MNVVEAKAWLEDKRSMCNNIPMDPLETYEVRVCEANASMLKQAYWVLRAYKELLTDSGEILVTVSVFNQILHIASNMILDATCIGFVNIDDTYLLYKIAPSKYRKTYFNWYLEKSDLAVNLTADYGLYQHLTMGIDNPSTAVQILNKIIVDRENAKQILLQG